MAGRWVFAYVLVSGFLALAGCGKDAPVASGPQGTYDQHCAQCHAQAGEKGGPPAVGSSKGSKLDKIGAEPGRNAEYFAALIRDPKSVKPSAKMPAFGDKLTDAQIKELAEWLAAKK